MNLSAIDLNLLVAFEALMLERSVSGAGRRLGLGQPATSALLARLRVLFGDELFVRAGGEMRPSPKALALSGPVGEALARLRAVLSDAMPFEPETAGRAFVIGSTDYASQVILPGVLEVVSREAPHVDLRVIGYEKSEIGLLLDRGQADLILGVFPEPPERCVKTRLFRERFVGVARASHPLLAQRPVSIEAFAAALHALITLNRDASGVLDDALRARGLKRRIALTMPHIMALPPILRRTDLVSLLPSRIVQTFAGAGVELFDPPVALDPFDIEMIWNPVARSDAGAAWLRRIVTTVAARIAAGEGFGASGEGLGG